jgi:dolichyl-diphosphooligosaccharide--protein glycosyltransferase
MTRLRDQEATPERRAWIIAALLVVFALAVGIRGLRFENAFLDEGVVRFALHDASYHARRALYSFVNFPAVLVFDPYIAYPDGAPVPIPPLYDWMLAGVARLIGDSALSFERVAAWASPVLSALTVWPIYAVGRRLGGPAVGLGAAFLFALLPASTNRAGVGNPDHHAAVALIAACWLASLIAEATPDRGRRRRALQVALHAAVVAAMILVWSGSLLYLILGEGTRLIASAVVGRHPDRLFAQSASALLAAVLVAPWVALSGSPVGGPFSTTELSWMQVVVLGALAVLAAGLAVLENHRPQPIAWKRALRVAAMTLLIALPLLSVGAVRESFASGAGFLAKQDSWAELNPEQQPLFASATGKHPATVLFGWYAFLVPLAPLLVALRWREEHPAEALLVLLAWTTVLGALTLGQVRYAMDFAVVGSVVFAWTLSSIQASLAPRLTGGGRVAGALVLVAGLVLLVPALGLHAAMLGKVLKPPPSVGGGISPNELVRRFAEEVRRATPETSGFLEPGPGPEYGLLVPPTLGHSFVYIARRPVPASNFGPYLDAEKYDQATAFYHVSTEAEAVAIAEELGARYAVTQLQGVAGEDLGPFVAQLQTRDGAAGGGRPALERFRLITESPAADTRPASVRRNRPRRKLPIPFKLFERVEGAVLEARGEPGELLTARVPIATPVGRRFSFLATSRADASGIARVRVPYSTDESAHARAVGPYTVRIGGASWQVRVPDVAVRKGGVIRVSPDPEARDPSDASAGPTE